MPKSMGGLGLPNFMFYYWSANTAQLNHWVSAFEYKRGPSWALMEIPPNSEVSPLSILSSPLPVGTIQRFNNPVIKNSIRILLQFRKHFNLNSACGLMPLTHNHLFSPSQNDAAFHVWHSNDFF